MMRFWLRVLFAWFYVQAIFYGMYVVYRRLTKSFSSVIEKGERSNKRSVATFLMQLASYSVESVRGFVDRTAFATRRRMSRALWRMSRAFSSVRGAFIRLGTAVVRRTANRVAQTRRSWIKGVDRFRCKLIDRHRTIRTRATLNLFVYLKRKASTEIYLEHLEQLIAGEQASDEVLTGAVVLASGMRNVRKASRFGEMLVKSYPEEISLHQNAAVQCFLDGNYRSAKEIWTRSSEEKERLIREKDLDRHGLRFLGPSWFIAIGHVAHIDIYLKHQIISGNAERRIVPVIPSNIRIPNQYLLGLWRPFFDGGGDVPVFDLRTIMLLQDEFWSLRFGPQDTEMYSYAGARVQQEWEARKLGPLLSIPEADREKGQAELERLGVPRGRWFVCLHVREAAFHRAWHKTHPGTRNADVLTYLLAAQAIIDRGGFVIRMGDNTMTRLPPMPGLIDYAHSESKSEFMDVFLCASCRFFIGTNSGLGLVPPVFGVPCALTNWSPIGLPQWYPADLFIPKLIYSEENGRVLSYEEMLSTPAGWSQFENFFAQSRLKIIDNTAEELRDLVVEMIDQVEGTTRYSEDDMSYLQRFERIMRDRGSYVGSRIGCAFVKGHMDLLGHDGGLLMERTEISAPERAPEQGVATTY